jgi:hypothetical protein
VGKAIRSHHLNTYIGKEGRFEEEFRHSAPGICMSAATLAFLGGEYRFIDENSKYGVHRFSFSDGSNDVDYAQKLSASMVEYIASMGVDTELFSLAAETPADCILELPRETLQRINVINNGQKKTVWTIESLEDVLYLRGARETIYGTQKFLVVFPAKGNAYMHIIFEVGRLADLAMGMQCDRFLIDGEYLPAHEYRIVRFIENGLINLMYAIPDGFLARMISAETVGFSLQFAEDAAVFLGYERLPCAEGSKKLAGLVSLHSRGAQG